MSLVDGNNHQSEHVHDIDWIRGVLRVSRLLTCGKAKIREKPLFAAGESSRSSNMIAAGLDCDGACDGGMDPTADRGSISWGSLFLHQCSDISERLAHAVALEFGFLLR
jgi:hypothetical protein